VEPQDQEVEVGIAAGGADGVDHRPGRSRAASTASR
jgi:hypothetical protein